MAASYVIRDSFRLSLKAAAIRLNPTSVLFAELIGVWAGLHDAVHILKQDQILLEGDSAIVIYWITSLFTSKCEGHPILWIVYNVKDLSNFLLPLLSLGRLIRLLIGL